MKFFKVHRKFDALKDLDDWEQELTERFERGELTAWEALGELTDIKLTRLKILGVPGG